MPDHEQSKNTESKSSSQGITRRDFLKTSARAIAGLATLGLTGSAPVAPRTSEAMTPVEVKLPEFEIEGAHYQGVVQIEVRPEGSKIPFSVGGIDFRPERVENTRNHIQSLLENNNYLAEENDHSQLALLAQLTRADNKWFEGLTTSWENRGGPSKISEDEFEEILKEGSPKAYERLQLIKKGPEMDIPPQTGSKKLVMDVKPEELASPKDFYIYARTKTPWFFAPPGTMGARDVEKIGENQYSFRAPVGRVYVDRGQFVSQVPEGINPVASVIREGKKTQIEIGHWE